MSINAKFNPPNIAGSIPAFTGRQIVVPFSMNKTVAINTVKQMYAKIKTAQSDAFVCTLSTPYFDVNKATFIIEPSIFHKCFCNQIAEGDEEDDSIYEAKIGTYYKLQLAYQAVDDTVGYYSTVGIIKLTGKPEVTINGLDSNSGNAVAFEDIVGVYSQRGQDVTEKVYSYNFKIYDKKQNLIEDSGELLHNSTEDIEIYESKDIYHPKFSYASNSSYYIKYTITTINGLEAYSPLYHLMTVNTVKPDTKPFLDAIVDNTKGCVHLTCEDEYSPTDGLPKLGKGLYEVSRKKDDNEWEVITRFTLQKELFSSWSFDDYTVEPGAIYVYSIRQYGRTTGLYSNREYILSDKVQVDFDDIYLYDGERQLCIKFNPKVNSFKDNVLEQKMDTIGSVYPFFFRNGYTKYKEFPISGLISFLMDENESFMKKEDYDYVGDSTHRITTESLIKIKNFTDTDLVSENYTAEKKFKLEVLEWLNNGKVKLFRSPTEGSYLVRLMNVSLTPQEQLGRMIHSFSCTAYEAAKCDFENMIKYGIIHSTEPDTVRLHFATFPLSTKNEDGEYENETGELLNIKHGLQGVVANSVEFTDMMPGEIVNIKLYGEEDKTLSFVIGATGALLLHNIGEISSIEIPPITTTSDELGQAYEADYNTAFSNLVAHQEQLNPSSALTPAELALSQSPRDGNVTIGYYSEGTTEFDIINGVTLKEVAMAQYFGDNDDLLNTINNVKQEVVSWNNLRFEKRPVEYVYCTGPDMIRMASSQISENSLASLTYRTFDNEMDTTGTEHQIFFWDKRCDENIPDEQKIDGWNKLDETILYQIRGFASAFDTDILKEYFSGREIVNNEIVKKEPEVNGWGWPILNEEIVELYTENEERLLEAVKYGQVDLTKRNWKSKMNSLTGFNEKLDLLIKLLSDSKEQPDDEEDEVIVRNELRYAIQRDGENCHLFEGYFKDRNLDKYYPYAGAYIDAHARRIIPEEEYKPYVIFNKEKDHFNSETEDEGFFNYNENNFKNENWVRNNLRRIYYVLNTITNEFEVVRNPIIKNFDSNLYYRAINDYGTIGEVNQTLIDNGYSLAKKYNKDTPYYRREKIHYENGTYQIEYVYYGKLNYRQFTANTYYTKETLYYKALNNSVLYGIFECPYCGHHIVLNVSSVDIQNGKYAPSIKLCPNCNNDWTEKFDIVERVMKDNEAISSHSMTLSFLQDTYDLESNLQDSKVFEVKGLTSDEITSLYVGTGIVLNTSYIMKEWEYTFEDGVMYAEVVNDRYQDPLDEEIFYDIDDLDETNYNNAMLVYPVLNTAKNITNAKCSDAKVTYLRLLNKFNNKTKSYTTNNMIAIDQREKYIVDEETGRYLPSNDKINGGLVNLEEERQWSREMDTLVSSLKAAYNFLIECLDEAKREYMKANGLGE